MSIKTTKRLALGVIAGLVFAPFAAIAPASATQALTVSTITASRAGTTGVAPTIKIVNAAAIADTTILRIRIDSVPAGAVTSEAGTAAAAAGTTVHQYLGSNVLTGAVAAGATAVGSINSIAVANVTAGTGLTVTLGKLSLAGTYTFTAFLDGQIANGDGIGLVGGTEPFVSGSFIVGGAPTAIALSAASGTAISGQANAIFTTSATDTAGNPTRLATGEVLNITSSGTLAGVPASPTQVGALTVTPNGGDTATQTITVAPGGTLPGAIVSRTFALTVAAAGAQRATDFSVVAAASTAGGAAGARTLSTSTTTKSFAITATGATASAPALLTFTINAGSGTMAVNGVAVTSGSVVSVGTASATGSVTFTLTTDAFANTNNITILGDTQTLIITYATPAPAASEVNGPVVAAVGAAVSLTVTTADQFKVGYAGNVVSARSIVTTAGTNGPAVNVLGAVVTGITDATGNITLSVPAPAGAVDGTVANIRYTVKSSTLADLAAAVVDVVAFPVSYKTGGLITSMSVGLTNGTTPLTDTASTATVIPIVTVIADGLGDTVTSGAGYTLATATGTATGEHVAITPTTTPATPVTVTVSAGAHLSATTAAATVPDNKTTLVVESGVAFFAYATKVGTHTVTITGGGKTVAVQFRASNAGATSARNVALSLGKTTLVSGEQTLATVTVTDAFGNPVAIGASTTLTATATGNLTINGGSNTASLTTSATGVATFVVASFQAVQGTGTISVTGAQTTLNTNAQFGAAAGTNASTTTAGTNGFSASVATATATVSTTAPVVAIVYAEPTLSFVKDGGRIILSGTAVDGEGDIIIYTKKVGTTAWKERAKTLEVAAPGDYNGSIKAIKNNVVIRVKQEGTGLFSNQIIVLK